MKDYLKDRLNDLKRGVGCNIMTTDANEFQRMLNEENVAFTRDYYGGLVTWFEPY